MNLLSLKTINWLSFVIVVIGAGVGVFGVSLATSIQGATTLDAAKAALSVAGLAALKGMGTAAVGFFTNRDKRTEGDAAPAFTPAPAPVVDPKEAKRAALRAQLEELEEAP